jgi:hypothetical protein
MLRRWSLGLALSVTMHVAVVGGVLGWAFFKDAAPSAVDIDITGMHMEDLKDLPLGEPAPGEQPARPRPRARAPATAETSGSLASRADTSPREGVDEGADDEGGAARVTDLRQLGPEGSRFTMLLRVDRLKGTPFASPVDALLMRLPDRRDLLEGTGLELYDDFDALLVSTPNPMDYTVTFLAARHHLSDAAMRAAVDRGARATDRVVTWRSEGRRPWGERKARSSAAAAPAPATRDERIIVMPAAGLVVVTPPSYRALLLARPRRPASGGAGGPDGGAPEGMVKDGGPPSGAAPDGGEGAVSPSWSALLRRIDAEDGLLAPNAVAMVTAVDLFKGVGGGRTALMGLEIDIPRVVTAVIGQDPEPYVEVTADFAEEAEARHWETTWPALQRKLRTNPFVVLGGFGPLMGRVTSSRDGHTARLRLSATTEETLRLLELAAGALAR